MVLTPVVDADERVLSICATWHFMTPSKPAGCIVWGLPSSLPLVPSPLLSDSDSDLTLANAASTTASGSSMVP